MDLETPKKYTFALVEVKWVFNYRDFSKIAVLFFMYFVFCVFLQQKMIDFEVFFVFSHVMLKNGLPER